jgi:uncharacterized membrane protein
VDLATVALRIVHIGSGVIWAGGAALFFFYIEPTINKLGPDAEKFVDEVVNRRKLPLYFMIASTLTVLAGVILYWRLFAGISMSPFGLALGLGGLAAIIAWLGGNLLIPRSLAEIGRLAGEMKAAGGPPSAELLGQMHATQERLRMIGMIDLILIGFAVVAMAGARYLG